MALQGLGTPGDSGYAGTDLSGVSTTGPGGGGMTPQMANALIYMLGAGGQAFSAGDPQSWQYQLGGMSAGYAKTQAFGELLKKLLGPGQKISADGKKTTVTTDHEVSELGTLKEPMQTGAPTPQRDFSAGFGKQPSVINPTMIGRLLEGGVGL